MIPAGLLALAIAAIGFHAIRRGTEGRTAPSSPIRWSGGGACLGLAGMVMVANSETSIIGATLWLFCILPLAGIIAILHLRP